MFSGNGADQEIIVSGGSPSLTDVLVVFYLLYRVFQLTIPRDLKFPMRKWE